METQVSGDRPIGLCVCVFFCLFAEHSRCQLAALGGSCYCCHTHFMDKAHIANEHEAGSDLYPPDTPGLALSTLCWGGRELQVPSRVRWPILRCKEACARNRGLHNHKGVPAFETHTHTEGIQHCTQNTIIERRVTEAREILGTQGKFNEEEEF